MHVKTCNNIYSHKLYIFIFNLHKEVTHRNCAIGVCVCVCVYKNLNSLKIMKAQVQIHYYLKRIRKNEPADIQDKGRTCRHLFFFILNIYTLFFPAILACK